MENHPARALRLRADAVNTVVKFETTCMRFDGISGHSTLPPYSTFLGAPLNSAAVDGGRCSISFA